MTAKSSNPIHPDVAAYSRDNSEANDDEERREPEEACLASSPWMPPIPIFRTQMAFDPSR